MKDERQTRTRLTEKLVLPSGARANLQMHLGRKTPEVNNESLASDTREYTTGARRALFPEAPVLQGGTRQWTAF